MSKYKLGFSIGDSYCGENAEIDLIDDYGYTEEEAKEIINDDDKQYELFREWRNENINQSYWVVKEE
ncbi:MULTISPECIES: hypothetical protein [Leptotrichia]|jgi:hypothetical protein F3_00907|uniref:Phage protein n=1 Tax=Leptotrichia rugosa TaxID=3239302 RepID=A0AB39VI22_9FUSO|nr:MULTISPECIES: hypothetical protein [Leptotrichia]